MAEPALRPRSGRSAKALLLTMLGEFVLPRGGVVWTSTIIAGLGELGISERNARQAAARLAEDGLIVSERVGRSARWVLTDRGRRLLELGAERIYGFGAPGEAWDGRWLVVHASVPESLRADRHRLRTRLGFAGFGFLGPGVAISPHVDREQLANETLRELEVDAVVFVARTGSFAPDAVIIERAWDLAGLADRYRSFLADANAHPSVSDAERFAAVVSLVHEWRRFPFDDPEIPFELLPDGWPGGDAKEVFDRCRSSWLPAAGEWFAQLDESSTVS